MIAKPATIRLAMARTNNRIEILDQRIDVCKEGSDHRRSLEKDRDTEYGIRMVLDEVYLDAISGGAR